MRVRKEVITSSQNPFQYSVQFLIHLNFKVFKLRHFTGRKPSEKSQNLF
jgi:hypothetical protein